jgi:hypothetical protein
MRRIYGAAVAKHSEQPVIAWFGPCLRSKHLAAGQEELMPNRNLEIVDLFLKSLGHPRAAEIWRSSLAEDIIYDLLVAQDKPLIRSLRGKKDVHSYLSLLPFTYSILQPGRLRLFESEDHVIAVGSERAQLVRLSQAVDTEWICIFKLQDSLIQRISMSIYRWTMLAVEERGYKSAQHPYAA